MDQRWVESRAARGRRPPAGASVLVLATAATLVVSCEGTRTGSSPPVAKVGGQVLTSAELDLMLRRSTTGEPTSEARWSAVERWVDRELLYREAVKRGIDQRTEVRLQVETAVRELVINALLEDAFSGELSVSDQEVEQYYNERRTLFRRPETTIHLRQIVIDDAREAREIVKQLNRNPEKFEEIARTRSTDPSSTEGGDLGYVSEATAYNAEIWQGALRLSDNEVSTRPIYTDAGWHILKVEDRRPEGGIKSLDEVRFDIINRVRAAKRVALITELVERQKLEQPYVIYDEVLGPRYEGPPAGPVSADTLDASQ